MPTKEIFIGTFINEKLNGEGSYTSADGVTT